MDSFTQVLIELGPWGMFISAFLAGSVAPFSSELVMGALLLAGVPAPEILITASVGNVLGAMLNYLIGRSGKEEWITKYLKVKPEKLAKAQRWVEKYGPIMGLLAWLPIIGSVITLALGYMRSPVVRSVLFITLGKVARYWILIFILTGQWW